MTEIKPLQKVLDRQPRRDRGPGDPGLQGRRHRQRGGVRRARPRRALRPARRRGARAWAAPPRPTPTSTSTRSSTSPKTSGADSVHPGYGFLAENAEFAQAVIDAGLVWIGPPPAAIEASATRPRPSTSPRRPAPRWRPAPRTRSRTPTRSSRSPRRTACRSPSRPPSAAAAAASRSPATIEEIPDAYESAVREAVTAFGRGECFVEKFLDQPRHVETQCLADQHGNVVVVSTRDCSLQRRHQKLVEEAPAPFLTDDQVAGSTSPPRRSCARPATSAPAPASSSSPRTAPSPSSRSTPASRSSTASPRRSPASTWSARCSASPPARSSATTTPRSAATRSSSGSTPRTAAATSCPPPAR